MIKITEVAVNEIFGEAASRSDPTPGILLYKSRSPSRERPKGAASVAKHVSDGADWHVALMSVSEMGNDTTFKTSGIRFLVKGDANELQIKVLDFERGQFVVRDNAELLSRFDSLFAGMQGPEARKAVLEAINSSPRELGRAAAEAARKR